MDFLTVEEVAKIIKCSRWFIYKNANLFGGVRFGKLLRFPKELFESKLKEVINDSISAGREVDVRLLEERNKAQKMGISDQTGSQNRRSGSQKEAQKDKYGFYRLVREKA